MKGASGFQDQDDTVFVPITTAMRRVIGTLLCPHDQRAGTIDGSHRAGVSEISTLLRTRHKLAPTVNDDFIIRNQAEFMQMAEENNQVFTLLLAGIASVSLLVGGIGIMNIMLVSVTERTREIGIRMALGARRRDILSQFLIESMALSLFGGVIGILLGLIGSWILGGVTGWRISVSLSRSWCPSPFLRLSASSSGCIPPARPRCSTRSMRYGMSRPFIFSLIYLISLILLPAKWYWALGIGRQRRVRDRVRYWVM